MNKRQAKKCIKHYEAFMVKKSKHGFWKKWKAKWRPYPSVHRNWRKQYRWILITINSDLKKMEQKYR